jgi:hypothetical protein
MWRPSSRIPPIAEPTDLLRPIPTPRVQAGTCAHLHAAPGIKNASTTEERRSYVDGVLMAAYMDRHPPLSDDCPPPGTGTPGDRPGTWTFRSLVISEEVYILEFAVHFGVK